MTRNALLKPIYHTPFIIYFHISNRYSYYGYLFIHSHLPPSTSSEDSSIPSAAICHCLNFFNSSVIALCKEKEEWTIIFLDVPITFRQFLNANGMFRFQNVRLLVIDILFDFGMFSENIKYSEYKKTIKFSKHREFIVLHNSFIKNHDCKVLLAF